MYLINFYKKYLQNLNYDVKQTISPIFHLVLAGIPSRLILSVAVCIQVKKHDVFYSFITITFLFTAEVHFLQC